jgi:hypothetical protein
MSRISSPHEILFPARARILQLAFAVAVAPAMAARVLDALQW